MSETNAKKFFNKEKDRESDEIDLIPIFKVLLKKMWIILLAAIIAGGVVFSASKLLVTPMYRSSFTAYVNNRSRINSDTDLLSSSDLTAAQELVRAYSKILTSREVLISAAKTAGFDYSYEELSKIVTTEVENETEIITVYVECDSPDNAYRLARTIANDAPNQIADIIDGSSMKIIDAPQIETEVYSPNYVRNTVIGAVLGFLIAAAVVVIRFLLDDKVKNENELENRFSLPVVGVIPNMNSSPKGSNYYYYEYSYKKSDSKRGGVNNG